MYRERDFAIVSDLFWSKKSHKRWETLMERSGTNSGEVSRSRFKNERITVLFDLKSESCETFEHQEDEKKGVEEDSFYWDEKLYSGENPVLGTKNLG
jgi:hypothetical protein